VTRALAVTREQAEALDLGAHTAVTAGAGSGKTFILVERYVRALDAVRGHAHPLSRVVAVTFTERATAEMRARVRTAVRERLARARKLGDREGVAHWRTVLGTLAEARISTLHGLCASLLRELPLEANIDPDLEILDAPRAEALIEEAVNATLAALARENPRNDAGAAALEQLLACYRPRELREMLGRLFAQREIAETWARAPRGDAVGEARQRLVESMRRFRETLGETCRWIATASGPPRDVLTEAIVAVGPLARSSDEPSSEVLRSAAAALLTAGGTPKSAKRGRKEAWGPSIEHARKHLHAFTEAFHRELGWTAGWNPELEALAARNEEALAMVFRNALGEHAAILRGRLDFAGLEIAAAALLENAAVRARVQAGIDHLLVDEFQDTSPLQWRLLRALVSGGESREAGGPVLFFVGDEKQAIYEFRGGRVEVFREAQEWVAAKGGRVVSLADNYRTLPEIVELVNGIAEKIFDPSAARPFEPIPTPLVAKREGGGTAELLLHDADDWPGEAEGIAAFLRDRVDRRETILDPSSSVARPVTWGDIAVVVPFRRDFTHLEDAFAAARIPFQVLGGLGFFQTQEVSDFLALLRVLLDPGDAISLASVLRSPLFGFSDVLLWRVARPDLGFCASFDAGPAASGTSPQELASWMGARAALARWRAVIGRIPTSTLLARAIEETALADVFAQTPTGSRAAANVEKLLDLVREVELRSGIHPAGVVNWLAAQREKVVDEGEATEIGLIEGVRILTIHKSKGTEFPVLVVAGLSDRPSIADGIPLALADEGPIVRVGLKVPHADPESAREELARCQGYRAIAERERERRRAELKRVLYVALTRARDRLVLSAQRDPASGSAGDLLARHPEWMHALTATASGPLRIGAAALAIHCMSKSPEPRDVIEHALSEAGAEAPAEPEIVAAPVVITPLLDPRALRSVSVTELATRARGILNDASTRGDDAPEPATDAQASIELGARVHRTLASIRSAGDAWVADEACAAHVRTFLGSPRARSLFAAPRAFVEARFVLPVAGSRVEGVIDRLYLDDEVWTVLDFKTTRRSAAPIEELITRDGIEVQLAWYALAASRILELGSEAIVRTVAFFTDPRPDRAAVGAEFARDFLVRDLERLTVDGIAAAQVF